MNRLMTDKAKIYWIVSQVIAVTILHYSTALSEHHQHILYRELYFLPIILAAFWFGLKGGLWTSLAITACYLPFVVATWQGFSADDFNKIMEIVIYNIVGSALGVLRDREKVRYEQLLESESLAAMGKAISGIAHDMKTPLIAIGGFSKMVQRKLSSNDPSFEKLEIVIQETRRLENMVKEMLHFSKPLELELVPKDVHSTIDQAITVLENTAMERNVKIETCFEESLSPILHDPPRMVQVILNLLANAIQASPQGETVTVKTSQEKSTIRIDIIDRGSGIPDEQKANIFMPFFTTKKDGTGLGLAITKKIVEAHRGHLEVIDNSGKGVTFSLFLPKMKVLSTGQKNSGGESCLKGVD